MNKTVRKAISLIIAMTFMVMALAVPVANAAGYPLLDTAGWEIKYYKTFDAETKTLSNPVTVLRPGDVAYAQIALTNVQYFNCAQMTVNASNMTIESKANDDYLTGAVIAEAQRSKLALATTPGSNEIASDKLTATFYYTIAAGQQYEDNTSKVFKLVGDNVATAGVTMPLVTYQVKVADSVSGDIKLSLTTGTNGIKVGEMDQFTGRNPADSSAKMEANKNEVILQLPAIDAESPVELVKDDAVVDNVQTTDGVVPSWSDYSFRVALTDGTVESYTLAVKPASITDTGAYVDLSSNPSWAVVNDENTLVEDLPVTIYDKALGINKTDLTLDVEILATQYTLDPKPTINLPASATLADIPADAWNAAVAEIKKSFKSSDNGGTDWVAADFADAEVTIVDYDTDLVGTKDYTVTIAGYTLVADDVTVVTGAAVTNGKYQLADYTSEGKEIVVYKATLSADAPYSAALNLDTGYTDGTFKAEGATTETANLPYTIDAATWKAWVEGFVDGDAEQTFTVTFGSANIADGQVKFIAKDAQPTGNYRVKAGQTFPINYKGTVDTSTIEFQQEIQKVPGDDTTNEWVAFDASAYEVVLSDFDNTVNGINEVTVSLVGVPAITLDPATITVTVEINPTYTAKWFNDAAQIPVGTTEDEIKTLILIEAHYDDVKETVKVDLYKLAIDGYTPDATEAQSITVTYDGKAAGRLPLTLAPVGTGAVVNADIEIVGVDMLGLLNGSVTAGTDTFNFGLTNDGKVKLIGIQATAAASEFTLSIPGFSPVTISVADDQTVTVDGKLYAGEVANSAEKAINDADFYAVAANVGNAVADATIKYDINRDGKIDELDVAAVIANLGTELVEVTE